MNRWKTKTGLTAKMRLSANMKLAALTIVAFTLAYVWPVTVSAEEEANLTKLLEVYQYIEKYHVSGTSGDVLTDEAIRAMIEVLDDPYTEYFTPERYASFAESIDQNYVGIGVRIYQDEIGFVAEEVFPDSPAERAGIRQGDYIVSVNGMDASELELNELVEQIRGPEGTEVELVVRRLNQQIKVKVTRAPVQVPLVKSAWLERDRIGYIHFTTFSNEAEKTFAERLKQMKERGMKGLVVDLRDNSGGYLQVAENMAKHFLSEGTLIYKRDRSQQLTPHSFKGGETLGIPVVVLVNGQSASASEVLAGALRDQKAATLIGTRTYGKGSVQQIIPLSDGSFLKLTIEEYLTPKRHKVHGTGLEPDIEVHGDTAQTIAALKHLGIRTIEIDWRDGQWEINGAVISRPFAVWVQNNKAFLPARVVAALTGSEISWNAKSQAVELKLNDRRHVFPVDHTSVLLEQGTTWIELDQIRKAYPQIEATFAGKHLYLRVES